MFPGSGFGWPAGAVLLLAALASAGVGAQADPPALSVRGAVDYALSHNPELAAQRQQRGIAAANVVIARTYPHNPSLDLSPRAALGTPDAGILQHFPFSAAAPLELELRGQGGHRRQTAAAALSRAEWEVAAQELSLALRAVRAFHSVIYRQEKLRLMEDAVGVTERAVRDMEDLQKKEKERVTAGDLVLIRFEVQDARAQLVSGRVPLQAARQDSLRVLGATGNAIHAQGSLLIALREFEEGPLLARALALRPELQARLVAVTEAECRLRLEQADRWGNLSVGPYVEVNESKAAFVGAMVTVPLPLLNRKHGEVQLRQAELAKASLELRQTEAEVRRDVLSALARLKQVQELIVIYSKEYLPALQAREKELEGLYRQGGQGVDLQQVLELRRRLLKARESYLDALYDHGQVEADLAAAVGELELAFDPPAAPR